MDGTSTVTTSPPEGASGRSGRWSRLPAAVRVAVLAVLVVAVTLSLAIATLWFVQRGAALPNTEVAAIDVGGLTPEQIRAQLAPIATERVTDRTVFAFEGEEYVLLPTDVGYEVDLDATVDAAVRRGREGFPGDLVVRVQSYRETASFPLVERPDEQALNTWTIDLADRIDREEIRGDVTVDVDTQEVTVTAPQGLVVVDRDELQAIALDGLVRPGEDEFDVPAETRQPPIEEAELEALAEQVRTAISEPLTLRSDDAELILQPGDLARLVDIEEVEGGSTGTTLELRVTPESVDDVMGEVAPGRFDVSAVSSDYEASRTPPSTFDAQADATYRPVEASVDVVGGRIGARFDAELASGQLQELLREGAREAAIRLEEVEPELSPERAEELRPTHAIGTFTTYFQAGQVRNDNIRLLADTIDGTVVLPGEQFSINEISGERSCDKGYVPAGTIVQGELVDTCGGGTSQFGTTTFNAAFFSGVQLDQWRAHSWYISRYPIGREATLSYPQLDVKFTNTTEGAIVVKTATTSTSVTVTLYGQPLADAVSASHSGRFDTRDFDTEIRNTSSMNQGQESVIQAGTPGFSVRVVRDVALRQGGTDSQTITTTYVPQTRIIERGTRPVASSNPSPPDTEDSDDEDDDGDDGDDG